MSWVKDAASAVRALNGLICVYKPAGVSLRQVQHRIVTSLCRDLNELPGRPQEKRVEIVGATTDRLSVNIEPNYADDPLVVGPRYINKDFRCSYATHLGLFSSGVLLLGINEGTRLTYSVHTSRPTRAYKVTGRLGKATDTYFRNGKTVEMSTYKHVTRDKIDRIVAYMQTAHQRKMYEMSGVHLNSQTTFDMASQGLIRPASNELPILYGIKCVHFDSPYFTLEIQSINEYDHYLFTLCHDLGIQLKTNAHCTGVLCIRQGKFTLEHALLRKHWQLRNILDNIELCDQVLKENMRLLRPASAALL